MTSSIQSTAGQSFARPVRGEEYTPRVLPKTGIESLAETLVAINPNIQNFLETRIDKAVEDERRKGTRIALDAAKNSGELKDIRKQIADSNGVTLSLFWFLAQTFFNHSHKGICIREKGTSLITVVV